MEIIGWIRQGDKAACGGTVIEGSSAEISYGKGYSFKGARIACRKNCVIAEGFSGARLSNGRSQVIHGMLTTGGCPLQSTLNDIDGVGNESGGAVASTFYQTTEGEWLPKFGVDHFNEESPDEQVRAIDAKTGRPIPELSYFIEAPDGSTYNGHTDADGLCERITTFKPEELIVWFGEDAEKRREGRDERQSQNKS
jgi:uncharacterized Zn-binding protein involved in type VI secretion